VGNPIINILPKQSVLLGGIYAKTFQVLCLAKSSKKGRIWDKALIKEVNLLGSKKTRKPDAINISTEKSTKKQKDKNAQGNDTRQAYQPQQPQQTQQTQKPHR
jgi:hypothetical protein